MGSNKEKRELLTKSMRIDWRVGALGSCPGVSHGPSRLRWGDFKKENTKKGSVISCSLETTGGKSETTSS